MSPTPRRMVRKTCGWVGSETWAKDGSLIIGIVCEFNKFSEGVGREWDRGLGTLGGFDRLQIFLVCQYSVASMVDRPCGI